MTYLTTSIPQGVQPTPRGGRIKGHKVLFHITATLVALIFLAPIFWVVAASFRPSNIALQPPIPPWPTDVWTLDSYVRLEGYGQSVLHYTGNSAFVAIGTAALTIVVSLLAGYGFSRFRFPLKGVVFGPPYRWRERRCFCFWPRWGCKTPSWGWSSSPPRCSCRFPSS